MDFLNYIFPESGVETNILIPPLAAFLISVFSSTAGVSGAFLILPFQVSVLNFTSPAVSSTNFFYNVVAIPGGVYRYIREGRMLWPLAWVMVIGAVPGVLAGYFLRIRYLPDPRGFKLFAGIILLALAVQLIYDVVRGPRTSAGGAGDLDSKFKERSAVRRHDSGARLASGLPADAVVQTVSAGPLRVEYDFWGERYSFSTPGLLLVSLAVGVVGGVYGIGGGVVVAPFCVAVYGLPIYTVAGAALLGTFITSVAAVAFYTLIPADGGTTASPDWLLGLLFGIGGFAGLYLGARLQKYLPQTVIKLILGLIILYTAARYILQYF